MQAINTTAPVPQATPVTVAVKFHLPFKYSPRGFDMKLCKPGETVVVPEHIAKIACEGKEPKGEIVKMDAEDVAELAEEQVKKPAAPAAKGKGK